MFKDYRKYRPANHSHAQHQRATASALPGWPRLCCSSARVSLANPERPIYFEMRGDPINVESREATVLAIVLNELIVNAMTDAKPNFIQWEFH